MSAVSIFLALLVLCATASGLDVTRKKGASLIGNYTCNDAAALHVDDSWYYNWGSSPDPLKICEGARAAEFAPMIIQCYGNPVNCSDALPLDYRTSWKAAGVRHFLGFNEPDGVGHPHSVTAAKAAEHWPQIQAIAASFTPPLILVAPAISGSGWKNSSGGQDGSAVWLDDFLGNCSDVVAECDPSLIKYLAFHDYHGHAGNIIYKAEEALRKYGRKVWLTEFAVGYGKGRAAQDKFMRQTLPLLEASDAVARYAWFSSRNTPTSWVGESSLLRYDGDSLELESTGKIYAGIE